MYILVETIKNRPVDSNCYIIYSKINSLCVLVDPGTEDCIELFDFLEKQKLTPIYVILTHEHFDHIWGINNLLSKFNFKLICSENCLNAIGNKKKNLSIFYDNKGFEVNLKDIITISDDFLFYDDIRFNIIETPGHSLGSITIWFDNILFTGDVIIKDKKTVTKLPGGSIEKLKESLNNLSSLFKNKPTMVYPGHGESFWFNEIDFSKLI